jgi:uncharacterized protein YjlB
MVEKIIHEHKVFAIIIRSTFRQEGIAFFTPDEFPQQLGYMNRPKGYIIEPHKHIVFERQISATHEVLVVKSGKVQVDFFDDNDKFFSNIIITTGDVILLSGGGHGFQMLEDSELIEVKQGPYKPEVDKLPVACS